MKLFRKKNKENIYSAMPELDCDRLLLRKMSVFDSDDMFEYAQSEQVTKYLLWSPHESLSYTEQYLTYVRSRYTEGDFFDWAVVLKSEEKMIGTCGFANIDIENNCAEIGYVINPKYHGNGYAAEAVARVIRYGFEVLELNRIEAKYMVGNEASRKVMEKCNMTFEGINKESMLVKGEYRDIGRCAILKNEYALMQMPI